MCGKKLFESSYDNQLKTKDKDNIKEMVENIRNEYDFKEEEDKFLIEIVMKDKINNIKTIRQALMVVTLAIVILSIYAPINFTYLILVIILFFEIFIFNKEYRYAKIYLEVINKIKEDL